MRPTVGVVLGTRPEVIKLAPLIRRLRETGWCRDVIIVSGQHGDLVRQALADWSIEAPDIPPPPTGHTDPTELVDILAARLRESMAPLGLSFVLVQGDTATALAGAKAAATLGIPVGHVEAGLRTYDLEHPFPEEMYRQAIARLARLHFAPTPVSEQNLLAEGIEAEWIAVTGNTVVDALLQRGPPLPKTTTRQPLALVTLHRRELIPNLDTVIEGLRRVLERNADLRLMIPLHPNPAFGGPLRAGVGWHSRVSIVEPMTHSDFLNLLTQVALVITDSGGVQEEAAILGVPLVIVRRVTERPEVLANGRSVIAGFAPAAIEEAVARVRAVGPALEYSWLLGDGRAAVRIEDRLRSFLRA
jgi:UDP-N-acetylglucosamine 2-epimerase (non-hydrolysing)